MRSLKQRIHIYLSFLLVALTIGACDDMTDKDLPITGGIIGEENTAEIYILSEGLFNQNNSTLARHTFADNRTNTNYFQTLNSRGLGDTANDMQLYDDKLFGTRIFVTGVRNKLDLIYGNALKAKTVNITWS